MACVLMYVCVRVGKLGWTPSFSARCHHNVPLFRRLTDVEEFTLLPGNICLLPSTVRKFVAFCKNR